jgi:hypothetical protein
MRSSNRKFIRASSSMIRTLVAIMSSEFAPRLLDQIAKQGQKHVENMCGLMLRKAFHRYQKKGLSGLRCYMTQMPLGGGRSGTRRRRPNRINRSSTRVWKNTSVQYWSTVGGNVAAQKLTGTVLTRTPIRRATTKG